MIAARIGRCPSVISWSGRLLSREDTRVGELTAQYLRGEGIDVRTGTSPTRVRRDGEDTVVELEDGAKVRCDVTVAGTGRWRRLSPAGGTSPALGVVHLDVHSLAREAQQSADGLGVVERLGVGPHQVLVVSIAQPQ